MTEPVPARVRRGRLLGVAAGAAGTVVLLYAAATGGFAYWSTTWPRENTWAWFCRCPRVPLV
ncbi:hypothetical protein WEI85_19780 [Actinomycetes bacterium KLBMP 9797]